MTLYLVLLIVLTCLLSISGSCAIRLLMNLIRYMLLLQGLNVLILWLCCVAISSMLQVLILMLAFLVLVSVRSKILVCVRFVIFLTINWSENMSFRQRQKLYVPSSSSVISLEQITLENGDMVASAVDQGEKVLPDPELFDINDQLKAGINLEEVSSKVIRKRGISISQDTMNVILNQPKPETKSAVDGDKE